jgi:hypothetical protein
MTRLAPLLQRPRGSLSMVHAVPFNGLCSPANGPRGPCHRFMQSLPTGRVVPGNGSRNPRQWAAWSLSSVHAIPANGPRGPCHRFTQSPPMGRVVPGNGSRNPCSSGASRVSGPYGGAAETRYSLTAAAADHRHRRPTPNRRSCGRAQGLVARAPRCAAHLPRAAT